MCEDLLVNKTKEYVKQKLLGEATGHDWWHTERVFKTAIFIGSEEKADLFIVSMAALLHDISDWKFNNGDSSVGVKLAFDWLKKLEVDLQKIDKIAQIIKTMSYKGGMVDSTQETMEGMIVQDADRLDAIGAIGIGRTFAYGGYCGREMHNPLVLPKKYTDFEEYKNSKGTTINHFYEKLLLLKDGMNTKTGKKLALKRHNFMLMFLEEFFNEWNCIE